MNDLVNIKVERNHREWLYLAIACLAAFVAVLPVKIYGVPDGNDLLQHYQFALTFHDAIAAGDFFPGWAAKANYGFGSVGIRFYPPLAYYVMAFLQFLTGDWNNTSWLAFSFWMILGSAGVYVWAREWLPAKQAMFAGIVYALMPNHLTALYNYFLYGEFASAAILPFCFAFVTRICRDGKTRDVFCLAAAYALLILTHLPTTIVGSIGLFLYAAALLDFRKVKETLFKLGVSILLALAATAFYWVRMVSEMAWVNHSAEQFRTGNYGYESQFLPFVLHLSSAEYFKRGLWYADLVALLTVLLFLPTVLFLIFDLIKRGKNDFYRSKQLRAVVLFALISLFMFTPLSHFVWKNAAFLQKIQFPWRWMTMFTLGVTLALTAAAFRIWNDGKPQRVFAYPLLALFLVVMLFNITQIAAPTASTPYSPERFQTEVINGLLEGESYECWWTAWSKRAAFANKNKVSVNGRNVEIQNWADEERSFTIENGEAGTARIATFWYPHWQAEVNEQKVEIQRAEDGTMLIPLSGEKANVKLYFQEPFQLQIASVISILSWFIILAGLLQISPFRK